MKNPAPDSDGFIHDYLVSFHVMMFAMPNQPQMLLSFGDEYNYVLFILYVDYCISW